MKTRRFLGWVAMATMFLGTSCSSDELVNDYSPENAIQFGTYINRGVQSRASVITTKELGEEGFGVFAYYTGSNKFSSSALPNFMYNQEVTAVETSWNEATTDESGNVENPGYYSTWTYSPLKYWPNTKDDKVSFFAYAPYKSNVTTVTSNVPELEFVIPSTVKQQEDILYAEPILNVTKKKIDEPVVFTFKHALSRIGFEVQTTVDVQNPDTDGTDDDDDQVGNGPLDNATTVIIKNVKLSGAFLNQGKLSYTGNNDTDGNLTGYIVEMVNNNTTETTQTYELSAGTNADDSNFASPENIIRYTSGKYDKKYVGWGQNVTIDEEPLSKSDSYIMIIPKTFENDDKVTVEVQYDVVTVDSNLPDGVSIIPNTVSTSFTGIEFEAGKAYTLSLHLGLTSVKLTASVDDWDDDDDKDIAVNVPINTKTN